MFSIGMGGLPAEAVAVLTTFPGQRVEEFYASGALDREDSDDIVRALMNTLGHDAGDPESGDAGSSYVRSVVEAHRVRRYEFLTGYPF